MRIVIRQCIFNKGALIKESESAVCRRRRQPITGPLALKATKFRKNREKTPRLRTTRVEAFCVMARGAPSPEPLPPRPLRRTADRGYAWPSTALPTMGANRGRCSVGPGGRHLGRHTDHRHPQPTTARAATASAKTVWSGTLGRRSATHLHARRYSCTGGQYTLLSGAVGAGAAGRTGYRLTSLTHTRHTTHRAQALETRGA